MSISKSLYTALLLTLLASLFSKVRMNTDLNGASAVTLPQKERGHTENYPLPNEAVIQTNLSLPEGNPFAGTPAPKARTEIRTTPKPAAPALPPPAPSAPPIPFTYLGQIYDGEESLVFLRRGDRSYAARNGDTLDGIYKIISFDANKIEVLYLPLNERQEAIIR